MAASLVKTKTPGVYKRGSRYVVIYRDPDGRQRQQSARTYDEARALRNKLTAAVAEGDWHPATRTTVGQYVSEWVERHRGIRDETRDEYRQVARDYIVPQVGRVRLDRLTARHVDEWIGWLCDEQAQGRFLKDGTVRGAHRVLRSCLSVAVREGVIRHNPAKGAKLPDRDEARRIAHGLDDDEEGEVRVLTDEQLGWILALVPEGHRPLFELLAATGLRISEALGLRWRDVDLGSQAHVRVRRRYREGAYGPPKSKASRRDVPLSPRMADALRQHRARARFAADDDPVFATRRRQPKPGEAASVPLSYGNLYNRVLMPAREEAGVPWAGFHTFRHTCASRWFAAGRNAKQVSKLLGHSSASFTLDTYVHLMNDDLGEPVELPAAPVQGVSEGVSEPTGANPHAPARAEALAA